MKDKTGGLSLRDWFAGQALIGITTGIWTKDTYEEDDEIASMAYSQADAMLATERKCSS